MSDLVLSSKKRVDIDVALVVEGDHQQYHLGGVHGQVGLLWDGDSYVLDVRFSPWQAESLLLDLLANLHEIRGDKP